jgi:PKHD-type hydroxylase
VYNQSLGVLHRTETFRLPGLKSPMAIVIPNLLNAAELERIRTRLATATFGDGAATAGPQARLVKRNEQVPRGDPAEQELAPLVVAALERSPTFMAAALPRRMTNPMFSRYTPGMEYGSHVDNAVMSMPERIRTDISVTVFLAHPDEYDGGELVIEGSAASQRVKLPAGSAVAYPSTTVHHVAPVTRGARIAAVMWVQSLIREEAQRQILLNLARAGQTLRQRDPKSTELMLVDASYHNLMRIWAEC